jgi:hypothetical protein
MNFGLPAIQKIAIIHISSGLIRGIPIEHNEVDFLERMIGAILFGARYQACIVSSSSAKMVVPTVSIN